MSNNLTTYPHNPLTGPRPEMKIDLNTASDEQFSIIIVHKDQPEYLNICLQSINATSFNSNYEIIVVDNGSGKDSQGYLDDIQEEFKVIRNKKNLYWSAAANQGAALADKNSKYLIFMHCDVVILNSVWMDLLANVCETQGSGYVGVEMQSYFMDGKKVDFIQDWLSLFTRESWKAIGPWPEQLPQIGHSFILTIKAQNKGYKPQIMRNPICHHYKTFSMEINDYERQVEESLVTIPHLINSVQSRAV